MINPVLRQRDQKPGPAPGLDRRDFLRLFGGGLLVCLADPAGLAQESGRAFGSHELPHELSAWIHIGSDGMIKVFTGKVEVGQNIRTSLAQVVAEELRVPFDAITMIMGDTDLVPWDMGTFGSRTTPTMAPQLRMMASAARGALVELAAKKWRVDGAGLKTSAGRVTDPASNRSIGFGELTGGEKLVKVVTTGQALTPPTEWKIAGTPVPKSEGRDFVTGRHKFPSDIVRPAMVYGAILRPEACNAKLQTLDTSAAEKLPGVKVIRDGDFVGVTAEDESTAHQAVGAIHATWNIPPQPSNDGLFEFLKQNTEAGRDEGLEHKAGSVDEGMAHAELKLEERYTLAYIAHAPLEPRAAVAEWHEGKLTVWTGTQRPFGVRDELMQAFQLPAEKVRVIQPDMGSGYGGKHTGEAALEAARLARAAGKPVKVVWTRIEEFAWAYFRPAGVIEIRVGASRDGKLVAWEHHNYNSGPAAITTPYEIPNQLAQFHPCKSPLRIGSYRGLASPANHFARESHMDGMAHLAAIDPAEFRFKNLNNARLRAVLEAACDRFGWGKAKSNAQRGFGLACGTDKGGYVAACAELAIEPKTGKIRILRIVQAWESGAILNPDGLHNQIGGSIVQAIGGALFEQILFAGGKILNPHFAQYRVPRFKDVPEIDIVLIDRKDLPSAGAGETGNAVLAPAVANALFAASGTRTTHLPLAPRTSAPGAG